MNKSTNDSQSEERLARFVTNAFKRAKWWAAFVIYVQVLIFVVAVASTLLPAYASAAGLFSLLIVFVSPYINWISSRAKSAAEGAKRQHELLNGFGIAPSVTFLRDQAVLFRKGVSDKELALLSEGIRFESQENKGPRRAMENLQESAWFSKTLVGDCLTGLIVVAISVFGFSLCLLIATVQLPWTSQGAIIGRVISLTLGFALSIGIVRNILSYWGFRSAAATAESAAIDILKSSEIDEKRAIRALMEYQFARASAPMIPTWIWKRKKDSLNEAYAER